MQNKQVDDNHEREKATLKVLGPVILGAGILCFIIAALDFLGIMNRGMGGIGGMRGIVVDRFMDMRGPQHFWLFFLGLPLIFVGGAMCKFAFMGDVARYTSKEMAPVAKDTFNYMADGTKEGIKTVASAIHEGIHGETPRSISADPCPDCQTSNESDAKYCKNCGKQLRQKKYCYSCGTENDRDARFCDNCGKSLDA